jgi:hypothetical protein
MNLMDAIYAFALGALVALAVMVAHIIAVTVKREYYDVGMHGRCLEHRDPEVYALMYRAKQHAIRCRSLPVAEGLKDRLVNMYASFQPDSRYLRLERNLAMLTDPNDATPPEKRRSALARCRKDIGFLDDEPRSHVRRNFLVSMVLGIAGRLLLPERDGVTEPSTAESRQNVKLGLAARLAVMEERA